MCIAILARPNCTVREEILSFCNKSNPDGIGFAFPDYENDKLTIKKGYFKFNQFYEDFKKIPQDRPRLIHFRIASSGKIDQKSCHPFRVTENMCLVHNGILDSKIKLDEGESDTMIFVKEILNPLLKNTENLWYNPAIQWALKESIGFSNKMIFLDKTGKYCILNEFRGEEFEGCWFSNKSYIEERKKRFTNNTNSSSNNHCNNFYNSGGPSYERNANGDWVKKYDSTVVNNNIKQENFDDKKKVQSQSVNDIQDISLYF